MSGTAPAPPRPGMKRIPFPLESYAHPSPPLSAKRLLNVYAEKAPDDAQAPTVLRSQAGLLATGNVFGTGPVYAMNGDYPSIYYVASGSHFYRVSVPFPGPTPLIEDLGDIGVVSTDDFAPNLMVTIAVGVTAAVVCVPPRAYTCAHDIGAPLNQIGGGFPGARSVTYLDGYFVFSNDDINSQFFSSLLLDPADFDALDFAYADGVPNVVRRVVTLRGELWLFGDGGTEVWFDAGAADFPFRRQSGGVIEQGTAAIKSIAIADNSVFWLGNNNIVFRNKGYAAQRISTHAIEVMIERITNFGLLSAFAYVEEGHTFYCMNFQDRTLVYDCATALWHERSSTVDGSGPWIPYTVMQKANATIFGSSTSGRTFYLSPGTLTDDGVAPLRQVILPPLWADTNRAFCSRLQVEMEVGGVYQAPPGVIVLDWSDDGLRSFAGGPRSMDAGTTDGFRGRVFTTRLGSFRHRVFRLQINHPVTLYAVDADITEGAS